MAVEKIHPLINTWEVQPSPQALPKGLRGSYFRNGPAKFKVWPDAVNYQVGYAS
jgi:carotenoid cleavage dioxygenase-like enzyme